MSTRLSGRTMDSIAVSLNAPPPMESTLLLIVAYFREVEYEKVLHNIIPVVQGHVLASSLPLKLGPG
jgi:hypothetical protein